MRTLARELTRNIAVTYSDISGPLGAKGQDKKTYMVFLAFGMTRAVSKRVQSLKLLQPLVHVLFRQIEDRNAWGETICVCDIEKKGGRAAIFSFPQDGREC